MTVVLSYGLGVDSTALLLRWLHEPASRSFDLDELVVITAMTGDEWPRTGQLVSQHILPLLAEHQVRYVQVARASASQRDGIVVLDDSRGPRDLYLDGAFKLSDELTAAGTVPQCGGVRKCSLKAKGWVIDTFLAGAVRGPYRHAMGYESEEVGRARRDASYDTALRKGVYPLVDWGWDREMCVRYIERRTGVPDWAKSACVYCPFALTNKAGLERTLDAYAREPQAALRALLLEHRALCLNPKQGLIAGDRLADVLAGCQPHLMARFAEELEQLPHSLYEVRRVLRPRADDPTRLANASRSLQVHATGSRAEMLRALGGVAALWNAQTERGSDGILRAWMQRPDGILPARERFVVVAPAGAQAKQLPSFERWWEELSTPVHAAA